MSAIPADGKMRVLVIDDEQTVLDVLRKFLEARDYQVFLALSGEQGLELLNKTEMDVVITDVRLTRMDGFEVLTEVKRTAPSTEVIVMTGHGDIDTAVRAMKEGAFDFFSKPLKMRELAASLQRTTRFHALRQEKDRYRERLDHLTVEAHRSYGLSAIIGESPAIRAVKDRIELVCNTAATTVLIQGETGTGKELVARAIHYGSSRAEGPFVTVDCTSIPESLIESELYGHVKGAFTDAKDERKGYFEQANGGTLFLDEIGDMPPSMQTRLLRSLEERRIRRVGGNEEIAIDVRVVSATNRDLPQAISQQEFRQDLYFRLNTVSIPLPALRERREDILPLARHFLRQYTRELRKSIEGFTPEAEELLHAYSFPGNVRELRNTLERATIFCDASHISPIDLQLEPGVQRLGNGGRDGAPGHTSIPTIESADADGESFDFESFGSLNLADMEKEAIRVALQRTYNNQVQAAKLLGISRTALRRRLQKIDAMSPAQSA